VSLDLVAEATTFADLTGLLSAGEVDGVDVDFLSWGYYGPHVWQNHPHTHSFHEVCLAYAGSGTFTAEGTEHPITAGELFVARPGEVHRIVSHPADGLGIAFWGIALHIASAASEDAPGWAKGLLRTDRPRVSRTLGSLPELVAALAREAGSPRAGLDTQVGALGGALVVETGRAFASAEYLAVDLDPAARSTSSVAAMERFLADNLERPLQMADLAAVVHLSSRHASRLFADATGESPMAALRRMRLDRGARLLLESDEPIAVIARRCGYPEVRPFITAFRRRHGQPPGSFRAHGGTLHL
jgi:AraC-like DNA-binding protein